MKMEDGHADLTAMLDFFKCTPPLENPIGHTNQKGEMVGVFERIAVEMRVK